MGSTKEADKWNSRDFPFDSNYNDHFETPLAAYSDLLPLLNFTKSTLVRLLRDNGNQQRALNDTACKNEEPFVLYDPYYCNGRTKVLLKQLGFHDVVHEKRDFYRDIEQHHVPNHDVMITNPPYSDEHKQKCLNYCLAQSSRSFFLLMPNYVASRQYFRSALLPQKSDHSEDGSEYHHIVYLVPSHTYQFAHPDGTGHDKSPFKSLWFCGLPKKFFSMEAVRSLDDRSKPFTCKLCLTWSRLAQLEGLLRKRQNPKQRKRKRSSNQALPSNDVGVVSCNAEQVDSDHTNVGLLKSKSKTKSKYRDEGGQRKKKRF